MLPQAVDRQAGGTPQARLRAQTAWLLSGNGLATLLQAVYFLLLGRALGAHAYGLFAGAVAVVNIASQFSSVGMEMALLRGIARDRLRFGELWGRALCVSGLGGLSLLVLATAYGRWKLPSELAAMLPALVIADALFGKITQLASRTFQAMEQQRRSAHLSVLISGVRAFAAAVLFLCSGRGAATASAAAWAWLYAGASGCVALFAMWSVTRRLGWPQWRGVRRQHLAEGLSFSFSSSAISVYNDLDKALLAGSGMAMQAGMYAAAYRVVDVASAPIYSLFAAASPRLFRLGQSSGLAAVQPEVQRLLRTGVLYAMAAALALLLCAPALPQLFGPTFRGSAEVLRWLCLLPLLRVLHYAWGTAITACLSQWRRTAAQIAAAALNLGLDLWWIPRAGWRGAAVASLASDAALALMSFAIFRAGAAWPVRLSGYFWRRAPAR